VEGFLSGAEFIVQGEGGTRQETARYHFVYLKRFFVFL